MTDPFDLRRFIGAQSTTYNQALAELRAGAKRSHWMWWVFPQITGLGKSDVARHYAIRSLPEARAYLSHPLLGARLAESAAALLPHRDRTAASILGPIDALKLRSSLTLFLEAGASTPFTELLNTFFAGERDAATLEQLRAL